MWTYYPGVFREVSLQALLDEISPLVEKNNSRESCVFRADTVPTMYDMKAYSWEASPIVSQIKTYIESALKTQFDYCLAHIYRDGKSSIAWHNDKESLCEEIISVSFGQTRKFRLRKMAAEGESRRGWEVEFPLSHGDIFHMHRGCQLAYEHTIPKETTIENLRINFTFRKIDLIAPMLGL